MMSMLAGSVFAALVVATAVGVVLFLAFRVRGRGQVSRVSMVKHLATDLVVSDSL